MGIHEDDTLHTIGVESKTRGEKIVTARLIGYAWVSIADFHGILVGEAREEALAAIKNWVEEGFR